MKKVLLYFLFIDVSTAMQIYTNFYVLINHNKKGVCCSQTAQRVAMKRCLPAMASKYNKTYCTSHCFLTKKQFSRRCHSRSSCRKRMRGRCCCRRSEKMRYVSAIASPRVFFAPEFGHQKIPLQNRICACLLRPEQVTWNPPPSTPSPELLIAVVLA
jgi:hypothetical protein